MRLFLARYGRRARWGRTGRSDRDAKTRPPVLLAASETVAGVRDETHGDAVLHDLAAIRRT
jgi:hypothetical protein